MPASPPRFLADARPPELFPSEKRTSRHRKVMPPCRGPATPARLRGLDPLGNPLRRTLVAESRRPMLSWASLLGAPLDRVHQRVRPRTGDAEGAPRARASASRSSGRVRDVGIPATRRPQLCPHTRGRMDRARHHHRARDSESAGPSAPPPKRRPRRSLPPGTMVIVHGRSHGAPQNRRAIACTTRPKARVPRVHPRCPWSVRPASTRHRSVGSRLLRSVPEGRLGPSTRLALPMG
jgi:hypothetical protein